MLMCFVFYFYLFLTFSQKKCLEGGINAVELLYFAKNLVAICTHDRRLWIWIWIWIWMANFISRQAWIFRQLFQ